MRKLQPYQDFSLGMNDKDDPSLISNRALVSIQNMNPGRGKLSKRYGFDKYTPVALLTAIKKLYTFNKNSGSSEFLAVSNAALYKDTAGTLGVIPTYRYTVIEDCEDTWNESVDGDVTVTVDTTIFKAGLGSVKLAVAIGATAGDILATEVMASTDISGGTHIRLWIQSSVVTASGDLQLLLDNTASCASPVYTLDIPALAANTWTQVSLAYTGATSGSTAIISIGLMYAVDLGVCNIYLDEVTFGTSIALSSSSVQMLTYKDRELNDVVLLADTGKLKVYNPLIPSVSEVIPYSPSVAEQTNPGLNDLSSLTNFRAFAIKQDRIFALASSGIKNRLSFSYHDPALGYATLDYWPATFNYDLVSEQNDEAVTLRTFRNAVIVFNKRTLWSLTGDGDTVEDYNLNRINVPSGLLAPESVCFVLNDIFYLSDDNKIYRLFSTDQSYISASVISTDPDTLSSIETTLKGISLADKLLAVGTFFDGKYWLSFPDGTTLVYDTDLRCWTKYINILANSFLERDGVLYFSTTTGYIKKFNSAIYNDDGSAIVCNLKTKRDDYGFPVQIKKYRKVWIVAKQYEAETSTYNITAIIDDISIDIDNISTDLSGVWDESDWDTGVYDFKDVVQIATPLREQGKTIQYVISNEVLDEPLTIFQIVTQYKLKRAK